ncbi:MAG: c-type cytochrome [Candidatus Krumholzibacteriia bacterium]
MPRSPIYVLMVLVALSWVPLVLLVKEQSSIKTRPRLQVVTSMDDQPKLKAQTAHAFFRDGRAMRQTPDGTVARGRLDDDERLFHGLEEDGSLTAEFPLPVTDALMARGRERFDIFCAVCHGLSGDGNGPVHLRAERLQEGTWTPPTDLAGSVVTNRSNGYLYNTIANGVRNMPAYGPQIDVNDRWAIVAYMRALQRARGATLADVPEDARRNLP